MYEVDKYTVSLLHFDSDFTDETGKAWTANGSPVISSAQSRFGGKSLYLDGVSYLRTPAVEDFNFGTEDFTIDWWEYKLPLSSAYFHAFNINGVVMAGDSGGLYAYITASDDSVISKNTTGTSGNLILNNWTHRAIVRSGNSIMCFENGNLFRTISTSKSIKFSGNISSIGSSDTNHSFNGYIDEFRISNTARWKEKFDPKASVVATTNLIATAGDSKVTLVWTAVDGATSYNVKRSTTSGGTYTTIASGVTDTSYTDRSVINGTTYFYVVVAVKGDLVSSNSNEASATPVGDGKALLCVTMIDSSEREYQLSIAEIDAFINWFSRTVGTGTTCYVLNKNVGVHNSKEYLAFEKIISFEVTEL